MQLQSLLGSWARLPDDAGLADIEIAGLTADSREVGPGALFAALSGAKADGATYAADAVRKGAVAVLAGDDAVMPDNLGVPIVRASEPRRALALMAAKFFGSQPATAVAVTGTSGKTSVVEFTRQIFASLGRQAASLGTIGLVKPDGGIYGSLTTPDPVSLHGSLQALANEGVSHIAFEASSHGLDQFRLDGVHLTAGAFTNLGRDHLDYHANTEDYFAAKLRLFLDLLKPGRTAVVDLDAPRAHDVIAAAPALKFITVGRSGETLNLTNVRRDGFGQVLSVLLDGVTHTVRLPLVGDYQVSNALVAAGLVMATGENGPDVLAALEQLKGVKGRLDIVGEARGGLAVVDYAHKPEALIAALDAVRPFVTGRLYCVFGCGGDRDAGKRAIMGRIAVEKSDVVIVTDDNPRTEDAALIRKEILAGTVEDIDAEGSGSVVVSEIGDRAQAIKNAVSQMSEGDVVLVAGKGHETGQLVGDQVLPFSDHDEIARALEDVRRSGTEGGR